MNKKIILLLIILLAFAVRFYRLNDYPALNADEAAIGYNAWSLIETGKDEHGNPWPIHFQSFNDYKPGLYFYLVLPFVKIIGLNEWAVRIPGALLGVGTVIAIYFLARLLFKNVLLATVAGLLLAINPWHIHFSRGGWEVNAATFLITAGLLFLLKAIENNRFYIVSMLFFIASLYTYHSARIIVPVLLLGFTLLYSKKLIKHSKVILMTAGIGLLLLLPLIKDMTGEAVISRAAGVGLFADSGPLSRINEQRGEHASFSSPVAKIFHNKAVNYGLAFLQNWGEHYWGEFLFLSGDDIERNKIPETGQFYMIEVLFVVIGLLVAIRNTKQWKLILFWLIVAPLAAALTFQSPHSLRAHNMVIPVTVISALGLSTIIQTTEKLKKFRIASYGLLALILLLSFGRYLHMYYFHMAKEYPFSSQYGVKELAEYLNNNSDALSNIVITDRYDQPYVLLLFYLKYSPEQFQNNHSLTPRDRFGFSTVRKFDKFVFKEVDFEGDRVAYPNSLIIGTDEQIPDEANIIKQIYGSNGKLYFEVVKN